MPHELRFATCGKDGAVRSDPVKDAVIVDQHVVDPAEMPDDFQSFVEWHDRRSSLELLDRLIGQYTERQFSAPCGCLRNQIKIADIEQVKRKR